MKTRRSAPVPPGAPTAPAIRLGGPCSLADVARAAGVSTGTVSRVLSRPEMISAATRERVMAAVDRLGYVANGAARALAARRTRTIGALVPRLGGSSFPTMVQALESAAAEAGYTLLLSAPEHARAQDPAHLRSLVERGVDAVALLGTEHSRHVFTMLAAHRLPFVMLWATQSDEGPCIGFDEAQAAELVVQHLAQLGHHRIAFIGGRTADNERARRRYAGALAAIARHGLTLRDEDRIETAYGFREGYEAMQSLLERATRATAVVCGNDYLAAGALSALDRAGVTVPGQMSVASFNDNDFAAYLHPPLTTVRIPIREIGRQAGLWLLGQLRHEPMALPGPLPVELVVRSSTGPVAGTHT